MAVLSLGKLRALQACSTPNGAISILALDHRNNLRHAMNPDAPDTVSDAMLTAFKIDLVRHMATTATAVLLDPQYSIAQCVAAGAVPSGTGLIVALEETGYTGDPTARQGQVLPGWSVAKAKRMGALGIKLLVYYHPESAAAPEIEAFVKQVGEDCAQEEIPLYLEPLSYSLDPAVKKLPPQARREVVIETARRLTPLGVDILKAEFPLDTNAEPDERVWEEACAELTAASIVPWVLLSASVSFETYVKQVTAACRAGACGVAVGRAVWQEAVTMSEAERAAFFLGTGRARMSRITGLVDGLAKPWSAGFDVPDIQGEWYKAY